MWSLFLRKIEFLRDSIESSLIGHMGQFLDLAGTIVAVGTLLVSYGVVFIPQN